MAIENTQQRASRHGDRAIALFRGHNQKQQAAATDV
jgi:hypothetical protein